MNFTTFRSSLMKELQEELQKESGKTVQVRSSNVRKNNGVMLEGIIINRPEEKIAPTIYIDELYERFENGEMTMQTALENVKRLYYFSLESTPQNIRIFEDYSLVQEQIAYKLIQYEGNKQWLESVPHIRFLDMAIVFYCIFHKEEGGFTSITVQNRHLHLWGVELGELYESAKKNTPELLPASVENMVKVLNDFAEQRQQEQELKRKDNWEEAWWKEIEEEIRQEEASGLYVLSNEEKTYGAAVILYPDLLERISEKLQSGFYLLPSSVHEMIMVISEDMQDKDKLRLMVQEINLTQVPEEEILTDSVYYYNRLTKEVELV